MANTIISEYKAMPCSRCGGAGRIAQFQHRNGGECFRCGATGVDPVMKEISREMTVEEIIAVFPFDIVDVSAPVVAESEDYLDVLFNHGGPTRAEVDAAIVAAYKAM